MPEYYEIKVKGHLDQRWSKGFAGLKLTYLERDEALLSGPLPDQAAIHGLLERIRDLNLTLISVTGAERCNHNDYFCLFVVSFVLDPERFFICSPEAAL